MHPVPAQGKPGHIPAGRKVMGMTFTTFTMFTMFTLRGQHAGQLHGQKDDATAETSGLFSHLRPFVFLLCIKKPDLTSKAQKKLISIFQA